MTSLESTNFLYEKKMIVRGVLCVLWCGTALIGQPALSQTTHSTSLPAFNYRQETFNQSEETTSQQNQSDVNQWDHNQEFRSQEDHMQDGYNQTHYNTSRVQTLATEESLRWLGDCDTLPYYVNLSFYHLSNLSATLFNTSCVSRIWSLNLSYNQLSDLDPGLLTLLTWLHVLEVSHNQLKELPSMRGLNFLTRLDLSHNLLHSLPPGSLPIHLRYLDLSFNSLTQMVDGVFHGLHSLCSFDLSHNQIYDIQPGAFETRMESVMRANFSYNQLTVFDAWPYIFSRYLVADLRHNHIAHFTNRMNVTISFERFGTVDLRYNNLTSLHSTDLSIYLNGKSVTPMILAFHFRINIRHNPVVCDCHLHWAIDLLFGHLLSHSPDMMDFFTCAAPPFLRGRNLGFLIKHGHLLVCEILKGCPQGCQCTDTPHHGHVVVSCDPHLHNYTALPAQLPAQGLVSLSLSRHALRHLEAGPCDVSRLKVLDVSYNQVTQVSSAFLDLAIHLEELDLRHNQLTSLPSALQRLAVDRLYIVGNPLVCSCHLEQFANWAKTMTHNMSQTVHVTPPNQKDTSYTEWAWRQADTDLRRVPSTDRDDSSAEKHREMELETDLIDTVSTARTTSTTLAPDLLMATCSLSGGRQVSLMDTFQWGLDCQSQHVNVHVLVWIGVMVVLVVVGIVVFWRWRYSFRVLISYARSWCPVCLPKYTAATVENGSNTSHGMTPITNTQLVYVSLDEKDDVIVTWACQRLLPALQDMGHNSLRVYLPLKDELPGGWSQENRADVISNSHKFLLILTPGYCTNGQCRQELDYACHHHQTRCHKNIVIVLNEDHTQLPLPTHQPEHRSLVHNRNSRRYDDINNDNDDSDGDSQQPSLRERPTRLVERTEEEGIEGKAHCEGALSSRDGIPSRGKVAVLRTQSMPVGTHDDYLRRSTDCTALPRNGGAVPAPATGPVQGHGTPGRSRRRKPRTAGRDRQELLEGLSQFWDHGVVEAVEPLRSFLLQRRYLSTSDRLFRQKLLFELSRK